MPDLLDMPEKNIALFDDDPFVDTGPVDLGSRMAKEKHPVDADFVKLSDLILNEDPFVGTDDGYPGDLLNLPLSQGDHLSLDLWAAILGNDATRVEQLLDMGASPKTVVMSGESALNMADRLRHLNIIKLFFKDMDFSLRGLDALLTAVRENRTAIVQVLLEMDMWVRLTLDENAKLIVFGTACKYAPASMIDTLCRHGPRFNWRAHRAWCIKRADEGDYPEENRLKIYEVAAVYTQEADAKFIREHGALDPKIPRDVRWPSLLDIMGHYVMIEPEIEFTSHIYIEYQRQISHASIVTYPLDIRDIL